MKDLASYQRELQEDLTIYYGKDSETLQKLKIITKNCETRISRRIKASDLLEVYEKYYSELFEMIKLDYNDIGSEGEIDRTVGDIQTSKSWVRPSDIVLSTIPQCISRGN